MGSLFSNLITALEQVGVSNHLESVVVIIPARDADGSIEYFFGFLLRRLLIMWAGFESVGFHLRSRSEIQRVPGGKRIDAQI